MASTMVALMVVYWVAMMVELREHCSVVRKVAQKADQMVAYSVDLLVVLLVYS